LIWKAGTSTMKVK